MSVDPSRASSPHLLVRRRVDRPPGGGGGGGGPAAGRHVAVGGDRAAGRARGARRVVHAGERGQAAAAAGAASRQPRPLDGREGHVRVGVVHLEINAREIKACLRILKLCWDKESSFPWLSVLKK